MKNWFGWDLLVDGGRGKMWMAVYVLLVMGVLKKCYTCRDGCMFAGGVQCFERWNGVDNSAHILRRNR